MPDDFTPETLRDAAEFITGLAGADDKTADAMTRLMVQMRAGSAGQADYDAVQDALDDATGRPRRKHQHPLVWKIRHWWYWHITDPIICPVLDAPGEAWQFVVWHCWRKWTDRQILTTRGYMSAKDFRRLLKAQRKSRGGESE